VIQSIRWLLNATSGEALLEPMDAAAVLSEEVAAVERRRDDVDASIPDQAWVRANTLLGRVFGNLLSNAIEHNDVGVLTIRVTMTRSSDAVTVDIADDGPGIPDEIVDDLFERPDSFAVDHGVGLYLIGELVEQYDGTIDLVETGDDGSVFRVELPRVSDGPEDRADASTGEAVDRPRTG
jgi:signal transduction histidine kinase